MMKYSLLSFFVFLSCINFSQIVRAETQQERIEAATRYEKIVSVEDLMKEMTDQMSRNPQLNLTQEDVKLIYSIYDMEEFRQKLIQGMAKHFTVKELDALTEFYSKPEGKSVMKKMPAYMNDFMPYIQSKTMEAARIAIARRQQKEEGQ